jgi:hypothetical protein
MIENGLILTGSDAELLSRALSEVKSKVYEESEASLDDTQALDALVSCFRNGGKEEPEKERLHAYLSPLGSVSCLARLSVDKGTRTVGRAHRGKVERWTKKIKRVAPLVFPFKCADADSNRDYMLG